MVNICASVNCSNKLKKGCGLSFHQFPLRNADLLNKWIKATRRKDFVPNHYHKLCSVHFREADFFKSNGKRILKENVVPSIFDFTNYVEKGRKKIQKEFECEDENDPENVEEINPPATIFFQPNFQDQDCVEQEKEPLSEDFEDICVKEEVILEVEDICIKEEVETEDVADICVKEENILEENKNFEDICVKEEVILEVEDICIKEEIETEDVADICVKEENIFEEIDDISVKEGNTPVSDCGETNDAPSPEDSFSNRIKITNVIRALSSENKILPGERPYQCDECQCSFETYKKFFYHTLSHLKGRKYQCDICQKGFKTKRILSIHMKTHGGKPYVCDKCHKSFARKVSLSIHKLIHAEKSTYQCDICVENFATNEHLSKHKLKHEGERAYQCDKCEKSFKTREYLLMHRKKHTSDSGYQCNVCQESFVTEHELSSHQESHTEKRTYQCIICKQIVQGQCIHFVVLERNSLSQLAT